MSQAAAKGAYTLWSRGRLLGQTDLGFVYRAHGFRSGWFYPTPAGERLMPAATAVAPALRLLHILGDDPTVRADFRAAVDREQALELQLRGPNGAVIATESVGIADTHYLRSIAALTLQELESDELDTGDGVPGADASFDELEAFDPPTSVDEEGEEPDHPRFQIQILLTNHDAIP